VTRTPLALAMLAAAALARAAPMPAPSEVAPAVAAEPPATSEPQVVPVVAAPPSQAPPEPPSVTPPLPPPPLVPPGPGSELEAAARLREEQRAPRLPLTFAYSTGFVSTSELGTGDRFGVGLDAALLARTPWFLLGGILGDNAFVPGQGLLYGARASVRRPVFPPLRADLSFDLGAQRFTTATVARDVTHLTDGIATLPFAAVRFGIAWNVDVLDSYMSVSAMARTTMGSASGTFAVRHCDGAQCVDGSQAYRFGGAMVGLVLSAGVDFDLLNADPPPKPALRTNLPPPRTPANGTAPPVPGSAVSPLPTANPAALPAANPAVLPGGNPAQIPAITAPYPPTPAFPTASPTPAPPGNVRAPPPAASDPAVSPTR
jgi:hypothetical protein